MTRSDLGRARTFVFTHLFGPAVGTSIIFFLFAVDTQRGYQRGVIAACICGIWTLPFILKITGNLPLVATASMQNLLFVTLFGAFFYGGVASPFLPWLLVALLLGFSYLSDRPNTVIAIFSANILGFLLLWYIQGTLPQRVPLEQLSGVGLISVFGATLYVAWMAIYYGLLLSSESELDREVSRHRETAARLLAAKDKAVQANKDKSIFLAKMSHELRTPLNAVIGYSEILLEEAEDDSSDSQRATDLRRINTAGKHLLSLVTDVLDLSKIESDEMEIRVQRFSLNKLLEDVISTIQPLVKANRNRFVGQFDASIGEMHSDETRMRQVVINLLSNAAKFTEGGTITLVARRSGKWMEIDIRDTGIGIAKQDLGALFQDFSQVSGTNSQRRQGTGLGLVLSQKLCTMMGGGITVESEVGRGSCFTIRVPIDLVAVGASRASDAVPSLASPAFA